MRNDPQQGIYSVAAWNVYALCFIPGFLRRPVDPALWIESRLIDHRREPVARLVDAR